MRINVKRQFNYTERVKLPKNLVKLRVWQVDGAPPRVVVDDFGLNQISVPHEAEEWLGANVVLEANRHTTSSFQRVEVGPVSDVAGRAGAQYSGTLEEFDSDENIAFTIKVVSARHGRLLAEAKNIRSGDDGAEKHELLKVQEHDLGQEPWRLTWEDGVGPIIQVNKRLSDRDNFLTRDAFMQGAALPTALRMVLLRLLMDRTERETPWGNEWLRFAATFAAGELPEDDEEGRVDWVDAERWVNEVLAGFCERFSYTDRINDAVAAPSED